MKLSILLVNQNNRMLLAQALNSLINACKNIDYEVIVVDNASADGSAAMLANDFPAVHVIQNKTDLGIAKANNQGIARSTGEYILIVTPDTKCGKDSIAKMCAFMDEHNAAGLGVRLLSPLGRFLPESIHGLTKSWAAFLKLCRFAKYLPKTRLYDRKRRDWVEEFQVTEVDIINSSCMLLRKSVLNETGWFDERFYKYGQDIDLSYRIRLAGHKNYYFPKTYFIKQGVDTTQKPTWTFIKEYFGAMFVFGMKYIFHLPEIKIPGLAAILPPSYEVKG